jgi:hypothetical protein
MSQELVELYFHSFPKEDKIQPNPSPSASRIGNLLNGGDVRQMQL